MRQRWAIWYECQFFAQLNRICCYIPLIPRRSGDVETLEDAFVCQLTLSIEGLKDCTFGAAAARFGAAKLSTNSLPISKSTTSRVSRVFEDELTPFYVRYCLFYRCSANASLRHTNLYQTRRSLGELNETIRLIALAAGICAFTAALSNAREISAIKQGFEHR